jgi:hypothetical protein
MSVNYYVLESKYELSEPKFESVPKYIFKHLLIHSQKNLIVSIIYFFNIFRNFFRKFSRFSSKKLLSSEKNHVLYNVILFMTNRNTEDVKENKWAFSKFNIFLQNQPIFINDISN